MIGVTGATGEVGRRVATRLAEGGILQRLIVRDPSRAPHLPNSEIVQISAYGDATAMQRALTGVRTLFLVSAKQAADRVQQHITAVDAAVAAGVQRIVYLSFLGASPLATFTFAQEHFRTEEHIRATGLHYTFLRPSLYLDRLPSWVGPDGVIRGPAGHGRLARIARDDLADTAAVILTQAGHDGQTYDVTGPEARSLEESAEQLSLATGRTITYHPETVPEAYASRSHYGAKQWEIESWVSSYLAIATAEMDIVSDTVLTLTGRRPLSLTQYLRKHPESVQHLIH